MALIWRPGSQNTSTYEEEHIYTVTLRQRWPIHGSCSLLHPTFLPLFIELLCVSRTNDRTEELVVLLGQQAKAKSM